MQKTGDNNLFGIQGSHELLFKIRPTLNKAENLFSYETFKPEIFIVAKDGLRERV